MVLVGPSGCGKTTTMKMINRIIEPTSGRIFLQGEDVTKVNPDNLRRRIGYVIQQIGLFPHMTIADNIATVPRMLGWEKKRTSDRIDELLETVGIDLSTGTVTRRSYRAGSASASGWPGRWPPIPRSCSWTSRSGR